MQLKWSTNLIPFSPCHDKFVKDGYRAGFSMEERIKAAGKVPGLQGVELHYPHMVNAENLDDVRRWLQENGLACSIVTPSLSTEPAWQRGALTNGAAPVRAAAIARICQAMDVARQLGASRINLWPGLDGYDYAFQADYQRLYTWMVAGIQECADYAPDVQICLEYKAKEPRSRVAMATVGKILAVIHRVDRANVGGNLDVGHAFMAMENPAESAVLLSQEGKLFHLHLNDTPGDWDWDMIAGTAHIYEFVELFYWLREIGYSGWYSFDQYPRQEDPIFSIQYSIKNLTDLYVVMERLDRERMAAALIGQRYEEILPELRRALFGRE